MLYFGAHMSVSSMKYESKLDIIKDAFKEISKLGGNCIQIFIASPLERLRVKILDKYSPIATDLKIFIETNKYKLFVHSPYILNLGRKTLSPQDAYWIKSFYYQLQISDKIGACGYIIHVGKHLELNKEDSINYMYISLLYLVNRIIKEKMQIKILLETAAGQGTEMLTSLYELAEFYNRFNSEQKKHIKICIDTCHIYSAGIDIGSKIKIKNFFKDFNDSIGNDNIGLIHLNDSKTEFNSHKDRHQNLGKGSIGLDNFKCIVQYARKYNIPLILETPNNGYLTEIPWIKKNI